MLGVLDRFPALLDVGLDGARQTGDGWSAHFAGDALHGGEILRACGGEAGLDHVDAQARKLLGHLDLLRRGQREPERLLAVAQRGIEKGYVVSSHHVIRSWWSPACS